MTVEEKLERMLAGGEFLDGDGDRVRLDLEEGEWEYYNTDEIKWERMNEWPGILGLTPHDPPARTVRYLQGHNSTSTWAASPHWFSSSEGWYQIKATFEGGVLVDAEVVKEVK